MAATLELKPIPADNTPAASTEAEPTAAPNVLDKITAAIEAGADMTTLTRAYLKLRGAKQDLEAQAKKKLTPIVASMDLIENHMLAKMDELGVDSLKNESGTPYRTTKVSITKTDNEEFINYVLTRALSGMPLKQAQLDVIKQAILDSGQLALVDARPAKTAIESLLENTGELPPGLARRAEYAVNIKAS